MKRTLLIFAFMVIARVLLAPESRSLLVPKPEVVNPYRNIITAVGIIESGLDTTAINWTEMAVGYFQIRAVRLLDYNSRTGDSLTIMDMLDYQKAERVFMFYATEIGWRDAEKIIRDWNGGYHGMRIKATISYYQKVKVNL